MYWIRTKFSDIFRLDLNLGRTCMKLQLAKSISLIFGFPWFVMFAYLLIHFTQLSPDQYHFYRLFLPFIHIIVPVAYFVWALKTKRISDIDISKREERIEPLTVIAFKNLISIGVIYKVGGTTLLLTGISIIFAFTVVFLITSFWKISLHMTVNTMGVILFTVLVDPRFIALSVLLPVVAWSRYFQHKHTKAQLLMGVLVPGAVLLSSLMYFKLL